MAAQIDLRPGLLLPPAGIALTHAREIRQACALSAAGKTVVVPCALSNRGFASLMLIAPERTAAAPLNAILVSVTPPERASEAPKVRTLASVGPDTTPLRQLASRLQAEELPLPHDAAPGSAEHLTPFIAWVKTADLTLTFWGVEVPRFAPRVDIPTDWAVSRLGAGNYGQVLGYGAADGSAPGGMDRSRHHGFAVKAAHHTMLGGLTRDLRALTRLRSRAPHPNVVELQGYAATPDGLGLVMPWYNATLVGNFRPPSDEAQRVTLAACFANTLWAGMTYVNEAGLDWRDAAISNVMIAPNGEARMIDPGAFDGPTGQDGRGRPGRLYWPGASVRVDNAPPELWQACWHTHLAAALRVPTEALDGTPETGLPWLHATLVHRVVVASPWVRTVAHRPDAGARSLWNGHAKFRFEPPAKMRAETERLRDLRSALDSEALPNPPVAEREALVARYDALHAAHEQAETTLALKHSASQNLHPGGAVRRYFKAALAADPAQRVKWRDLPPLLQHWSPPRP